MSSFRMAFPSFAAFIGFIKLLLLLNFSRAETQTGGIGEISSPVISSSVANHICRQQNDYQETSQIQPPQKNRPQDDDSKCGWYSWTKCDDSNPESCPSFVLQSCDEAEPEPGAAKKKGRGITTPQEEVPTLPHPCDNSTEKGVPDPIEMVSSMSKYPWVVTIEIGDRCRVKRCTGLILDQNWIVVPLLGCFHQYQPEHSDYYEVVAGERRMYIDDGTEQRRSVGEFIPHPGFLKEKYKFYIDNIGLVRVSSPFELNENVEPIDLSAIEAIAPSIPKSTLKIVGWLLPQPMKEEEELLASLIEAPLDFVPMDECYDKRMEDDETPRDILVCAGTCLISGHEDKQPSRNILFAQENSESPLVPVGLGPLKHKRGKPYYGVFVNLVSYIPWIKETAQGQGQGQGESQRETTESSESESRIIRGEEAPPHKYKSMVNIEYPFSYACTYHGCGGSILNEEWFVTAAHCVDKWPERNITIVAGDHDISDSDEKEQIPKISKVILHQSFNSTTLHNDIAVVQVTPPFVFNDKVQKVTLPEPSFETTGILTVIGWGVTEAFIFPHILRQVQVQWVSTEECAKYYPTKLLNLTTQMCAGLEKGHCSLDSGGPLYHIGESGEQILIGIVSAGGGDTCKLNPKTVDDTDARMGNVGVEPEGEEKAPNWRPGVYTKVNQYIDWIRENAEMTTDK